MQIDSKMIDSVAKFFRILGHLDFSGPMKSRTCRDNLAHYLTLGCPKLDASLAVTSPSLPEGANLARLILGDDFLSQELVGEKMGWQYSDEQLGNLPASVDLNMLMWLRQYNYFLTPTHPTKALNLLDVRALDPSLFCSKKDGWYADERQKFAREEALQLGSWLAIRKDVTQNSILKKWEEQQKFLTREEHVPMACELAYGIVTYSKVRGVRLYERLYSRTSSVSADGGRVYLGGFDAGGLRVDYCWDGDRDDGLGIASSRKM